VSLAGPFVEWFCELATALKSYQATYSGSGVTSSSRKASITSGKAKPKLSPSTTPIRQSSRKASNAVATLSIENELDESIDHDDAHLGDEYEPVEGFQGSLCADLCHDIFYSNPLDDSTFNVCSTTVYTPFVSCGYDDVQHPSSLETDCVSALITAHHDDVEVLSQHLTSILPHHDVCNLAALQSAALPSQYDEQFHAHIDHGANVSVSKFKCILWGYRDFTADETVPCVRDLGSTVHHAQGRGFYCQPLTPHPTCILIPALFCPTIHDNILSPGSLCQSLGDGASGTVLSHDQGTGLAFIRIHSPSLKLTIRGVIIHEQLWTQTPFISPTSLQHTRPIPHHDLSCDIFGVTRLNGWWLVRRAKSREE
jgi:hypothetical protein